MATCVRFAAPVLLRMLRTWLAAVFSLILSLRAISRLLLPLVSNCRTSISRGVRPAGGGGPWGRRPGWGDPGAGRLALRGRRREERSGGLVPPQHRVRGGEVGVGGAEDRHEMPGR